MQFDRKERAACRIDHVNLIPECADLAQKPRAYARSGLPLALEGPVVEGFGRGSKQLGFPTANLDPGPLQQQLQPLPLGVYWG